MLYLKSPGIWFILAVSAIIVARFRVSVLLSALGKQIAHQLGNNSIFDCSILNYLLHDKND